MMKLVASCDCYDLYYALGGKVQVFKYIDGSMQIWILDKLVYTKK